MSAPSSLLYPIGISTQKKPKFHIDDNVESIIDGKDGVIKEIRRIYSEVTIEGKFKKNGLVQFEDNISSIALPYEFDGETLKVHYPEGDFGTWIRKPFTMVSKFIGYAYVVKSETNYSTLHIEGNLKPFINNKSERKY